jgi:hypothetical protein
MKTREFVLAATLLALACQRAEPDAERDARSNRSSKTAAETLQILPPPGAERSHGARRVSDKLDLSVLRLGDYVITLEETTLEQVRSAVGAGTVYRQGDGGESEALLCYTIAGEQRLWLTSGVIGSLERVDGFAARIDALAQPSAQCPELPPRLTPVAMNSTLWLGASVAQTRDQLGVAEIKNGWSQYHRDRNLRLAQQPCAQFDESSTLAVRFAAGRIEELNAHKITTC